MEHKIASGGEGLAFARPDGRPFIGAALPRRALAAWRRAGLAPITLDECRHTFASLMIAAGVNAKAVATCLGHANIAITFDRYGHLMPGNEDEAAALLDAYLARADTRASVRGGSIPPSLLRARRVPAVRRASGRRVGIRSCQL